MRAKTIFAALIVIGVVAVGIMQSTTGTANPGSGSQEPTPSNAPATADDPEDAVVESGSPLNSAERYREATEGIDLNDPPAESGQGLGPGPLIAERNP
ncbi:MAG: hypothetical protein WA988_15860 [Candidatus Nanopelagicales bacterium]